MVKKPNLALKEAGGLCCTLEIRTARPKIFSLVLGLARVLAGTPNKSHPTTTSTAPLAEVWESIHLGPSTRYLCHHFILLLYVLNHSS